MNSSIHLNNLVLFPLCDVHGVLIDTLRDTSDLPGTRADALLLGWRLNLPNGMDVSKAAGAVLVVAFSIPRKSWSERQLHIVRELMFLTERKSSVVRVNKNGLSKDRPTRRSRDRLAVRDAVDHAEMAKKRQKPIDQPAELPRAIVPAKESKSWWKLVGRDTSDAFTDADQVPTDQQNTDQEQGQQRNSGRRKTRTKRAFRDL